MMHLNALSAIVLAAILSTTAQAGVIFREPAASISTFQSRTSNIQVTVAQLVQIAPSSNTCNNAIAPDECRTASQAVDLINSNFQRYGITTVGEAAAMLGIMAFES